MIACAKCGHQNPLGRVFCVACGTKLELLAVTKEHVERKVTKWHVPVVRFFSRLIVALLIAAIALAGAAFWPPSSVTGEAGTLADAKPAREAFARARMKTKGVPPKPVKITEKQLNAHLLTKMKVLGVQSAAAKLGKDMVTVRLSMPLKKADPLAEKSTEPSPLALTIDVEFHVVENSFRLGKVTVGHLPLPGPIGTVVLDQFATSLADDKDWAVLTAGFQKLVIASESISATPKP